MKLNEQDCLHLQEVFCAVKCRSVKVLRASLQNPRIGTTTSPDSPWGKLDVLLQDTTSSAHARELYFLKHPNGAEPNVYQMLLKYQITAVPHVHAIVDLTVSDRPYMLMEYCGGTNLGEVAGNAPDHLTRVPRATISTMARFHSRFWERPESARQTWIDSRDVAFYLEQMRKWSFDLSGTPYMEFAKRMPEFISASLYVMHSLPHALASTNTLTHGDLSPANQVLANPEDFESVRIVDWGDLRYQSALWDIAQITPTEADLDFYLNELSSNMRLTIPRESWYKRWLWVRLHNELQSVLGKAAAAKHAHPWVNPATQTTEAFAANLNRIDQLIHSLKLEVR